MSDKDQKALSVIIIEDSFAVADSLRVLIEVMGHRVVGMAAQPDRALKLVEGNKFDVAILDIHLGNAKVTSVAAAVHERDIPIIYVSGYDDLDMLPENLRSQPLLPKPVNPEDLAALLDSIQKFGTTSP